MRSLMRVQVWWITGLVILVSGALASPAPAIADEPAPVPKRDAESDKAPKPAAPAAKETAGKNAATREQRIKERNTLKKEASELKGKGKFDEARARARQAIEIEDVVFGRDHPELIATWKLIAECSEALEDWPSAEEARDAALRISQSTYGVKVYQATDARLDRENVAVLKALTPADREALREADRADRQVTQLYLAGRYREAVLIADRVYGVRERLLGHDHPQTAASLNDLALIYKAQGNHAAAKPFFQRALKIREKALGPDHPDTATTLSNLAGLYEDQANYAAAEPLLQRALKIREKALGPEHPKTATSLNNLAGLYYAQGNYAAAEPLYQRALKIHEKALGPDHPRTATSLNNLAMLHNAQGNYAAAEPLYQRALKIREKALGPDHPDTAESLNNLAGLYENQGHYSAAEPLFQRALKIMEKAFGPDHPDIATYLNNLAFLYKKQGNYAAAEPLFKRALQIKERAVSPDHPDTASSLNNLATLYDDQGKYSAAEPLYQRALQIREKALGPDHPHTAFSLSNLAVLYDNQGNYSAAEPLYRRALKIMEKALGPGHPHTATSLNNLAFLYETQGKYAAAEPLFQQALSAREKALGPGHPDTASSLDNLAGLYYAQGNYTAAEPRCLRALKAREKALGPDHPDTATSLNNVAVVFEAQGRYAAAEPLYLRSLTITEKALGPDHPQTATSVNNLAGLYFSQGKYTATEPLYLRALKIREKALGPDHPYTATSVNNLALLYKTLGNFTTAEPLYQRALKIDEKALGPDHPETATTLSNLGILKWCAGQSDEARPFVARSLRIQIAHLERTAAIQTEQQQFLMGGKVIRQLDAWLTVTSDASASASETWGSVLTSKGATTARQLGQRQILKDDPDYAQLRQAAQQWSTLTLNPPAPPSNPAQLATWKEREPQIRDEWQKRKAQLGEELERLEKVLSGKSAEFRKEHERKQVSPDDLQAALRKQKTPTALVDLLEYGYLGKEGDPAERRIAAFVVRGDREIVRVKLGPAKPVAALVDRWRESFGRSDDSRQAAKELRERLWEPLSKHLVGCQTVLISPDGQVTRFPWGALPGEKPGTYLLAERAIVLIPTPQLLPEILSEEPRIRQSDDRVLLVGDVDFNADPPPPSKEQDFLASSLGELTGLKPAVEKLPGTGQEVKQIAELYRKTFGAKAQAAVLTQGQATESALNESAPQARLVHIATHGFFEEVKRGRGVELASNDSRGMRAAPISMSPFGETAEAVPLVRSGLLLASVNRPRPWSVEDGKWTALEVGGLDLSGVDLVVLSACETGVGTVIGGEGVLGLQRSFHAAGARTCVTSLWKVDDEATQVLMTEFYRNLWEKKLSKLEALRQAQLKMLTGYDPRQGKLRAGMTQRPIDEKAIEEARAALKPGETLVPPFYWAAFVLSGDWR